MSRHHRPTQSVLLLFLLTGLAACFAAPAYAETISVSYHFDSPAFESIVIGNQVYDRVIMPETPNSGDIGAPALPARGARILLPEGCVVERVEIIPGTKVPVGRAVTIEPVQRPYPLSADASEISATLPDPAVYALTTSVPENATDREDGWQGFYIEGIVVDNESTVY